MANSIRILLADDHQMVRMGLTMMINAIDGFECVGQADDGSKVLAMYKQTDPDVVLLDIFMPGLNGVNTARELIAETHNTKVILMTAFVDNNVMQQAMECGAMGLFEKNISPDDFELAIRTVIRGKIWYDRSALKLFTRKVVPTNQENDQYHLSDRESRIGALLIQGKTNNQIAHELGMSVNTIKKDLSYLYARLKVSSRAEATALLSKAGYNRQAN